MDVILKPRILISVLECLHDRSADDETARDHVGQVKRDFTRTRADRVETRHGLVIGKTKFITGKEFNDPEKFPYSMTPDRKFGVMAALPPPRLRLPRIPSWKQIQMRPLRSADACRQGCRLESALSSAPGADQSDFVRTGRRISTQRAEFCSERQTGKTDSQSPSLHGLH